MSVLMCITGYFMMAFFFGKISVLIAKLNHGSTLYQEKLDELQNKMKANNMPILLQKKANEYFEYSWSKQNIFSLFDMSDLSVPLQKELLFFFHKDLVTNVPLFKHLIPQELLFLIQCLK